LLTISIGAALGVGHAQVSSVTQEPAKSVPATSSFNTFEFLGAMLGSTLQNSYYPRHDRSLGDTANRFSGALSSDAIEDLLRDFTPDMKHLFHKYAPKKILRIEEKLPIPDEDKP
jgi:hypothetical protein